MDRERADSGEFVPTVTLERVLAVFEAVEGPVITSGDVADELDCTTEAARRTLEELHEDGRLARRRSAGRLLYWRDDDEHRGGTPGSPPPERGRGSDEHSRERLDTTSIERQ